ncbi:MAG TPA: molybdenum cofactor guanylyltransferase [Candidatus Dormibacteraeota bacterium]|nr:molybdenum cofactor guanylyltransferase [Candidatus Dormibacteraeota bacterium]
MFRAGSSASLPMTGLVLCGGESSRMGFDKALLEVDGRPLAAVLADRLAEVCDSVMLASGWRGRFGDMGYEEVEDDVPYAGPLAGIVAGLDASDNELMAVVAVDMPAANPVMLRYLADRTGEYAAVVPAGPRGPEPAHAVYSRRALPVLRRRLHSRRRSLHGALAELDIQVVGEAELMRAGFGTSFAANLNEPDDLWMLRHAGAVDW